MSEPLDTWAKMWMEGVTMEHHPLCAGPQDGEPCDDCEERAKAMKDVPVAKGYYGMK